MSRQRPAGRLRSLRAYPETPSLARGTVRAMEDYAGAWSAERGRCHRLVYNPDGKPENCPEPPVAVGWRYAAHSRTWHALDACELHKSQLQERPRPTSAGQIPSGSPGTTTGRLRR